MTNPLYRILTATSNTPEWLGLRQCGVGASESAAILGDSEWGTPRSIYEQKVAEEVIDATTDLMTFGHLAEPLIVAFLELHPERYGYIGQIMEAEGLLQSVEWPWLLGTLDRQVVTVDADGHLCIVPLELKSVNDFVIGEWQSNGDDDEDAGYGTEYVVPKKYQVQVQQQMAVTGAPFAYVAVWLGKSKLAVIRVERDDDYIAEYLVGKIGDFWHFHVEARNPPPLTPRDDLWKVYPGDAALGAFIADDDLIDEIGLWRVHTTDARDLKKTITQSKFSILDRIGDHVEVADPVSGKVIHTLRPQNTQRKVDLMILEAKYPDAYAECVGKPGRTRVHRATKEPVG